MMISIIFALTLFVIAAHFARAARSLEADARWLARHGGITGTCNGCATPRMMSLAKALVIQKFIRRGSVVLRQALCYVRHESGFNPGALNRTYSDWRYQAAGLAQIEVRWHPEYVRAKLLTDPVYAVNAFWRLSRGGRDWGPWQGGGYSCP